MLLRSGNKIAACRGCLDGRCRTSPELRGALSFRSSKRQLNSTSLHALERVRGGDAQVVEMAANITRMALDKKSINA